jgi:hypothetical protein
MSIGVLGRLERGFVLQGDIGGGASFHGSTYGDHDFEYWATSFPVVTISASKMWPLEDNWSLGVGAGATYFYYYHYWEKTNSRDSWEDTAWWRSELDLMVYFRIAMGHLSR